MTESLQSGAKHMGATHSKGSSTGPPRVIKGTIAMVFFIVLLGVTLNSISYFLPSSSPKTTMLSLIGFSYFAILFLMLCVWEMAKRVVWKEPDTRLP